MKNISLKTVGIVGVSVLTLGSIAYGVQAYKGDSAQQGSEHSQERHEAMEQAFETNDYTAWAASMNGKGRITEVVDEENFPRFAEAHRYSEEGNYAEADKIRAELGLRTQSGGSQGKGHGQGQGNNTHESRGQNAGGNFVDANGDGACDHQ